MIVVDTDLLVITHRPLCHEAAVRSIASFAEILSGEIVGPRVHDARIAAICIGHGVPELWSTDRDFNRFPSLAVRNPLVG